MSLNDYARKLDLGRCEFVGSDTGERRYTRFSGKTLRWPGKPALLIAGAVVCLAAAARYQAPTPPTTELAMLQQAADRGEPGAQLQLGLAYREGRLGLHRDQPLGRYWIHRAADAGNGYARKLETGVSDEPSSPWLNALRNADPREQSATRLLEKARGGDTVAQYQLSMRYRDGSWGVNVDPEQARIWLERAAQGGNAVAMTTLADAYLHGRLGLAPDPEAAQAWIMRMHASHG